jgi:hypothetical protein
MAKTAAAAEPRDPTVLLPPCAECNGVECGTPRIRVCCEACTH